MPDVTINYNGNAIATMNASGTKTLNTEGTYCLSDIEVVYSKPSTGISVVTTQDVHGGDIVEITATPVIPYTWMGEDAELVQSYTTESKALSDTDFATWTPSTTAKDIVSSSNLGTQAIDTQNYEYFLMWKLYFVPTYDGSETNTARLVKNAQNIFYYIFRRPSNLTNISSQTNNNNVAVNINNPSVLDYYNNNSTRTNAWSTSYGIYMTAVAPTFSSSTSYTPTLTIKRPKITARCSTTYLSTTNCSHINQSSKYYLKATLWRFKTGSYPFNCYQTAIKLYNGGLS